jgi:hypothetical protein
MGRTLFERRVWLGGLLMSLASLMPCALRAQNCTTQAEMAAADRDGLGQAAQSFARLVQTNDAAGVRAATIPEYAQNFEGIAAAIGNTAPKLAGATLQVSSVYLLDASGNAAMADTQFFCTPASAAAPTIFNLPALPPGRYALTTVQAVVSAQQAWQLSFVLQQSAGKWLLAGFIPKPATAGGHDGLWYWKQARVYAKENKRWNAWLFYAEADALLSPVNFVSSPNRDKLHAEQEGALPSQLADGISAEKPLSVAAIGQGAAAITITAIGTQESADGKSLQLALHVPMTSVSEPAEVRVRSMAALLALLAAYPELRSAFPSAWVYADAPGQSSFGIEFNPLPPDS